MSSLKAESAQQDLWSRITGEKFSPNSSSESNSDPEVTDIHNLAEFDGVNPVNSSYAPRFKSAQYGRTIHHHRLKQPSQEEERVHLLDLQSRRSILNREGRNERDFSQNRSHKRSQSSDFRNHSVESEEDLVKKLSKALSLGYHSVKDLGPDSDFNINETIKKEAYVEESQFPSPTSTLCFPESHNDSSNYKNNQGLPSFEPSGEDNFFIGMASGNECEIDYIQQESDAQKNPASEPNLLNQHLVEKLQGPTLDLNEVGNLHSQDSRYHFHDPNTPCTRCCGLEPFSPSHNFVICADTQLGVASQNAEWETELEYSRRAIEIINNLRPRPLFVCVCGDLIDMEYSFEKNKGYPNKKYPSKKECDEVQDSQNRDFQRVWNLLHPDIALVCLCGNHDVGNRPTPASIQRFRDFYGDEYLAFWANGTYNIVLNNVLFSNPSGAKEMFEIQLKWLEKRLEYAKEHDAKMVFVFGHHPWFLYDEEEDVEDMKGYSAFPEEWAISGVGFPDAYFAVPKKYRVMALDLFRRYGVNAAFSGHFHQNVISKTGFGMDMIVTAPLSVVFESSGKPIQQEANGRGIRVVEVHLHPSFEKGGENFSSDVCVTETGGVRNGGTISHRFVPIGL